MRFQTCLFVMALTPLCAQAPRDKADLQRAVERDPNNLRALSSLARMSLAEANATQDQAAKSEKLDEASAWYRSMLKVDSRNVDAYYYLGVIAWKQWSLALQAA